MNRAMIAAASVIWMLANASTGAALTHTSDYTSNLDNYRVCTGDQPLETCGYDDVRAPSLYHLTNGTKGTVVYTGTVAKIRIDSLELDTNHPSWQCVSQSYPCVSGTCGATGKNCQAGPKQGDCCSSNADCTALACDGGPLDDAACTAHSKCVELDGSKNWSVVLRGNNAAYECSGGIPCSFELQGDGATGCIVACDFALDVAGSATIGSVNLNSVSCQMSGDCWYTPSFHHAEILDPDGNVLAIPSVGNAKVIQGYPSDDDDPAKIGDACRTQAPPPGDCP